MRFLREDFLRSVIFWLGAIVVIGVPLVISTGTLFPFLTGKQTLFQSGVTLMGIAYAVLLWRWPEEYKPPLNFLTGAVYAFLGAMTLSTIFSVDPQQSFWSTIERMDGLVHYLYWGVFFLVLTSVFRSFEEWIGFLKVLAVSSISVALYTIGQALHIPGFFPVFGDRMEGPLGNPTFLGGLAVMQIFAAGLLWRWARRGLWRYIGLAGVASAFISLILSGTRGAFLGLAASFAFLAVVLLWHWWRGGNKKLVLGVGGVGLAIVLGFGGLVASGHPASGPVLEQMRLGALQEGELPSSLQNRLWNWGIDLRAWQEHPIVGWGPATLRYAYGQFYNPVLLTNVSTWLEKAHNMPLEILVHTGLVGLLAYLAIFAAVGWFLWRSRHHRPGAAVILGALFTAYFVQNLFLFDTPSSLVYLAVLLALVAVVFQAEKAKQEQDARQGQTSPDSQTGVLQSKRWRRFREVTGYKVAPLALGAVLVISFPASTWKPWQASSLGGSAVQAQSQGNVDRMYKLYKQAFQLDTYVNEKLLREGRPLLVKALKSDQLSPRHKLVRMFVSEYHEYLERHPLAYRFRLGLSYIYMGMASQKSTYFKGADKQLEKAQALVPKRPDSYLARAEFYRLQNKPEQAKQAVEEAIALNEHYATPKWTKARLLNQAGQNQETVELVKEMITKKEFGPEWQQLAWLRGLSRDQWQDLERALSGLPEKQPDFQKGNSYKLSMAVVKQRLGKQKEAKQLVQEVFRSKERWQQQKVQDIRSITELTPVVK